MRIISGCLEEPRDEALTLLRPCSGRAQSLGPRRRELWRQRLCRGAELVDGSGRSWILLGAVIDRVLRCRGWDSLDTIVFGRGLRPRKSLLVAPIGRLRTLLTWESSIWPRPATTSTLARHGDTNLSASHHSLDDLVVHEWRGMDASLPAPWMLILPLWRRAILLLLSTLLRRTRLPSLTLSWPLLAFAL